jgi:ribosomal protein S18 acetylase RimI-like enzyme
VSDEYRGKGIGKLLLKETENQIIILGGEIAYLETSSQEKYIPTCKFYENLLYHKEAVIKDFYTNDDDKIIYSKRLQKI